MPILRLALPFLALLLGTAGAAAAPALWRVSDADSSVWLFGSVHMLRAGTDWRSDALDKVLSKADRVYFETDVSPEAQVRVATLTMELAFNRNGTLLSDTIGPELTDRVRAAAQQFDMPMPYLLTMRPWMAATTLSIGPLADSGYDPAHGVETVLAAEIDKGRIGFLETPEQQIGFLGNGSDADQIAMLEATLDTLDVMASDIDSMVEAWLAGRPEALGDIFIGQIGGEDTGMFERLIDQRNRNWVEQIEGMLATNENAILVVGAGHLVGEVSVVRLLEELGHTSERLQ